MHRNFAWLGVALVLAFACRSSEHAAPPPVTQPGSAAIRPPAPPPPDARRALPATTTVAPALPEAIDAALARRLDAVLDREIARDRAVGAAVAIAIDGKIVYLRAAGKADRKSDRPVRDDTQFRIASMTKPIVAVTALALVDRDMLSLDDPVTKYLPDFHPALEDGTRPTITIRELLTHTSGLTYRFLEEPDGPYHRAKVSDGLAEPGLSLADNLRRLGSVPLLFRPGTAWHYGLSYDVLGAVIARAGGAPLPEVVARLVTRPLGMTDSAFVATDRERVAWPYAITGRRSVGHTPGRKLGKHPVRMTEPFVLPRNHGKTVEFSPARAFDAHSYPSGGAGMIASARDYLRFCEMLRTGGAPVLRPETARAMVSNQIDSISYGEGERFGFGVRVLVDPASRGSPKGKGAWGWGGIYGTGFFVDPEHDLSFVMLANVAGDSPLDAELERALFTYLGESGS